MKLLLMMISIIGIIGSGCATPKITIAIKNEDIAQTKKGDVFTIGGNSYTSKYDGVWMRDELDKKLHDAKYGKP